MGNRPTPRLALASPPGANLHVAFGVRLGLPIVVLLLAAGAALQLSSRSGDAAFTCGTAPDVLSHGPRLGEVTGTSIKVWARACVQATVSVEYKRTAEDWSVSQQTSGVLSDPANDNTVVMPVTGLSAATSYDYRLLVGGQLPAKPFSGTFHTLPASGPMTFIISSDMHHPYGQDLNPPNVPDTILNVMQSKHADFSFMMGDQIVIEIAMNNLGRCCLPLSQADYELAYRNMAANSAFRNFAANTPLLTDWDDHEIANDWSASTPQQYLYPWAKNAYNEYFGGLNSDPIAADGIQYIYRAGGIEFFVLDTRTYRSADFAPDDASKTMLGVAQKQALKDWLLNSNATFKMIISSVMFSDFSGHTFYGESWPAFATERNEIMDYIKDNHISGVMLFSGDEHTGRVFRMNPWGIYEVAPNPLGWKVGGPIASDPQILFQSNFTRLFGLLHADTSTCPATLDVQLVNQGDVVLYDLSLTEADMDSDRDSDGLVTCEEQQHGTDPVNPDTDGDHCGDGAELGSDYLRGGQRNPLDKWDYFNPSGDGRNRIDDVLQVVHQFFVDSANPDYTLATDRTLAGPEAWRTGPPDGKQRVDDILAAVHNFFNDCTPVG
jgi:alkaline phosphatase D